MTVVVDTSVLIDHLRGDDRARRLLAAGRRQGNALCASVLTKVEVLSGTRESEVHATRSLLGILQWIPVSDELAERAGELGREYLSSHPGIDPVDFVIASTVERLDAKLWTRNLRHFPMIPGLADPY